jgi:hypothetical protein
MGHFGYLLAGKREWSHISDNRGPMIDSDQARLGLIVLQTMSVAMVEHISGLPSMIMSDRTEQ